LPSGTTNHRHRRPITSSSVGKFGATTRTCKTVTLAMQITTRTTSTMPSRE
jgi:hypothetical protein